ncbi:MAG: GFA family protein, partial [Deltaproteobacteria bacterium]|nr:GFA family protein [Deltaproteobacteria bacterium]
MNQTTEYQGSCFCGAVEFTLTGQPEAMGYCHCDSCRHWSAGQVNAFTLWKA